LSEPGVDGVGGAGGVAGAEGVDARPFEFPPERSGSAASCSAGVLLMHGLTGTPYEMRSLAQVLSRRGLHCRGPVLPGHDGSPEELAATTFTDWLDCARLEFTKLRGEFDQVFVVGMSMGGLLSLALAAEDRPDAVVSIGAPLRFSRPIRLAVPLLKFVYRYRPKTDGSDIRDDAARARHPGLKTMPLAAVHQLMKLQRSVAGLLGRVTAPILVAHGVHDHTADPKDARTILAEVNSGTRELNLYGRSGHIVTVDVDRDALAQDVGNFLLARLCPRKSC